MRNACCTTIAPTGSVSIIAGCSSGIEPIFSLSYRRRALDGCEFDQIHPLLDKLGQRDGWLTKAVRKELSEGVPASEIHGIPLALAEVAVTAHEIHPDWHVRMQAAVQGYVDNAVSKTVNLPADATIAGVDRVFRMAFKLNCKGITVYRDASRSGQTFTKAENAKVTPPTATTTVPRVRGSVTEGKTHKFRMGCGTLFVTVNRDDAGLCEVFANLGKAGGCPSQSEATCRAVSAALRSGVRPEVLIEQLRGIRCLSTCAARQDNDDIQVLSCPDAIARAIEMAAAGKVNPAVPEDPARAAPATTADRLCPRCERPMRKDAGCFVCDGCLHSSCG
jgi:ribonucleoside-diphosphate reductase alpha chain